MRWLDLHAGHRLREVAGEKATTLRPFGVAMLDPVYLRVAARKLVRALAWFAAAVLTYLWLNLVLELIPHTRPLGDRLTHMLLDVLATIGQSVLASIPGLAFVAVIFVIARFAASTGRAFFDRVKRQNLTLGWLDRDTAPPTSAIFSVGVWLFALAMAYPYLPGAQSQAFQGVSVLVGLMVSIGASGTVSQAASGLMLMYTRAYRVGEFVRIQRHRGHGGGRGPAVHAHPHRPGRGGDAAQHPGAGQRLEELSRARCRAPASSSTPRSPSATTRPGGRSPRC